MSTVAIMAAIALAITTQAQQAGAQDEAPPPPPPLHYSKNMVPCPVGGQPVEITGLSHYSTWGQRLDGRPYGSVMFPAPLAECPENGLVLYREIADDEAPKFARLIALPEYRAMRTTESRHYRAYWLASKAGDPAQEAVWPLLQATWIAKDQAEATERDADRGNAERMQRAFVEAVADLSPAPSDNVYVAMRAHGANALREMGLFDAAAAEIEALRPMAADHADDGWPDYLDRLATVVTRRDASVEPIDTVSRVQLPHICARRAGQWTDFERTLCDAPDVRADVERARATIR